MHTSATTRTPTNRSMAHILHARRPEEKGRAERAGGGSGGPDGLLAARGPLDLDLEHPVGVLRGHLRGVHALGERERPLEGPVAELTEIGPALLRREDLVSGAEGAAGPRAAGEDVDPAPVDQRGEAVAR